MPRKQERTPVSLNIILEGASGKRQARISDISLGGCFIDCVTPMNRGEIVSFQIKITEDEWLTLKGEVVHAYLGVGIGVRFTSLSEDDRSLLEHLILMSNGNPWGSD